MGNARLGHSIPCAPSPAMVGHWNVSAGSPVWIQRTSVWIALCTYRPAICPRLWAMMSLLWSR